MLNNIKQDCHLSLKEKFVAQLFCIMLRTTIYRIISRLQILYISFYLVYLRVIMYEIIRTASRCNTEVLYLNFINSISTLSGLVQIRNCNLYSRHIVNSDILYSVTYHRTISHATNKVVCTFRSRSRI